MHARTRLWIQKILLLTSQGALFKICDQYIFQSTLEVLKLNFTMQLSGKISHCKPIHPWSLKVKVPEQHSILASLKYINIDQNTITFKHWTLQRQITSNIFSNLQNGVFQDFFCHYNLTIAKVGVRGSHQTQFAYWSNSFSIRLQTFLPFSDVEYLSLTRQTTWDLKYTEQTHFISLLASYKASKLKWRLKCTVCISAIFWTAQLCSVSSVTSRYKALKLQYPKWDEKWQPF